jgi:hypothetical protein
MSNYTFSVTPEHIDEWYAENQWWVDDLDFNDLVYLCGIFYTYQLIEEKKDPKLKIQDPTERQKFVERLKSKFTFRDSPTAPGMKLDQMTIVYTDGIDISSLVSTKLHPFFHNEAELFSDRVTIKDPILRQVCSVNTATTVTTGAFAPTSGLGPAPPVPARGKPGVGSASGTLFGKKPPPAVPPRRPGIPAAATVVEEAIDEAVGKVIDKAAEIAATGTKAVVEAVKTVAPTSLRDLITKWQNSRRAINEEKREGELKKLYESLGIQKVQQVFDYITKLTRTDDIPKLKKAYYLYVSTTHPEKLSLEDLSNDQLKLLFGKDTTVFTDDLLLIDKIPAYDKADFLAKLKEVMEKLVIYNDIKRKGLTTPGLVARIYSVKMEVQPDDQIEENLFVQMDMTTSIINREYDLDVYKKLHVFWRVTKKIRERTDTYYYKYGKDNRNTLKYIRFTFLHILRMVVDREGLPIDTYYNYYREALGKIYSYDEYYNSASEKMKDNPLRNPLLLLLDGAVTSLSEEDLCQSFYNNMEYIYYQYLANDVEVILPRGLQYLFDIIYNAYRLYYYHDVVIEDKERFDVVNRLDRTDQERSMVTKGNWVAYVYPCMAFYNVSFVAFMEAIPKYDGSLTVIVDTDDTKRNLRFSLLDVETKKEAADMMKMSEEIIEAQKSVFIQLNWSDKDAFRRYFSCLVSDYVYGTKYISGSIFTVIDDAIEYPKPSLSSLPSEYFASKAVVDYNHRETDQQGYEDFLRNIISFIQTKDKAILTMKEDRLNDIKGWPMVISNVEEDGAIKDFDLFGKSSNGVITDINRRIYSWVLPRYSWTDAKNWAFKDDNIYLLDENRPTAIGNKMVVRYKLGDSSEEKELTVITPEKTLYNSVSIMNHADTVLGTSTSSTVSKKADDTLTPTSTTTGFGDVTDPGKGKKKSRCEINKRFITIAAIVGILGLASGGYIFGSSISDAISQNFKHAAADNPVSPEAKDIVDANRPQVKCFNDIDVLATSATNTMRDYDDAIKNLEAKLSEAKKIQNYQRVLQNIKEYHKGGAKKSAAEYTTDLSDYDEEIKAYLDKPRDYNSYKIIERSLEEIIPKTVPSVEAIEAEIKGVKDEKTRFDEGWENLVSKTKASNECASNDSLFEQYGDLFKECPAFTTDGGCGCMSDRVPDGSSSATTRSRKGRVIKPPMRFIDQQAPNKRSRGKQVPKPSAKTRGSPKKKTTAKGGSPKNKTARGGKSRNKGKMASPKKQRRSADGNSLLMVQTPVIPFNTCKVFKNI